ncbi:hypothetical protein MKX03_035023 [Papaver bracteatum]|nr:hypothetical protein MKX03_035023 [Papaver bracteatum]
MLFVSMVGYPALDLGKHQIDLTRLLPLNLEDLEEEKSSGKWTTSYKLSGKGKGASLNVSFGYMIVGDDQVETRGNRNPPPVALNLKQNQPSIRDGQNLLIRAGSPPTTPNEQSHRSSQSVEDAKILHEVFPKSDDGMVTAALDDSKTEPEVFSEQRNMVTRFFFSHNCVENQFIDKCIYTRLQSHQVLMHHEPSLGLDAPGKKRKKAKGGSSGHRSSYSIMKESGSEYVNLEDLAPLAMDKIEALSIEGLRIQSVMSDEEAPSNISPQEIGEISELAGKRANINGSLGLEGAGGLQLLDIKDGDNDVDGVMGLSITLDEWMKLDSGMIRDKDDQISERTSKILAAHHASSTELFNGGGRGDQKKGKGKKCGLLGNNFTAELMVQLRDPLSNYEPVGTPMLALIQVERNEDDDDETATIVEVLKDDKKEEKKEVVEEVIPQFKITEVHVAGLKTGGR